jgi:hypothetical protein
VIFAGTINQTTAATVNKVLPATASWVAVALNVTAMTGDAASAVFRLQWSMDGATWCESSPPDQFDPITAPGAVTKRFDAKAPYWRAVCELTGTNPSFTGTANSYS